MLRRPLALQKSLVLLATCLLAAASQAAERIVVLTADVAEIVVALGHGSEVVGRERVAKQPELAQAVEIGSSRSLSAEPILRLKPTLVIGSQLAMPEGIWSQLNGLGLKAVKVSAKTDGSDYAEAIRSVGKLIGTDAQAGKLAYDWQNAMRPAQPWGKRVLVTYEGKTVAGRDTPADWLIRAAGGINAAAGIDGYKPLDAEALSKLAPDIILIAEHNRAVYGGLAEFTRRADIAATPAGRNGRVYEVPVHEYFSVNLGSPAAVRKLRTLG
ncbi:heme/hemin ABC transporter substrate-binding protein [Chitinimonas sp.]|uniref:heme/hemin ABC transporter substrate-binding protein n=1 Tax=Chitinimonas sp. TaxID=1934313 RepID=UPI002F91E8CD